MVSEATLNKYATDLITHYVSCYSQKYGKDPQTNRHKHRWGFKDMINDVGQLRAKAIIDFYFTTSRPFHPVEYLLYNYERINKIMVDLDKDEQDRLLIRQETQERVKRWEERLGDQRG